MNKTLCTLIIVGKSVASFAAAFQNLGFDDGIVTNLAPIPGVPIGVGKINEVLPSWQLTLAGNPITYTRVDLTESGDGTIQPNVALLSQSYIDGLHLQIPIIIGGRFGLSLAEDSFKSDHFNLSQVGDIPASAKFLMFTYSGSPLNMSINGNVLFAGNPNGTGSPIQITTDISIYAGQNVTLAFEGLGAPIFHTGGGYFLDSIAFQVPEPNTAALLALGGGALLAANFRRRRRV